MTIEEEVVEFRKWKEAVINAAIVSWCYKREHETNPQLALHDVLCTEAQYALDPRISAEARALVQRGYEQGLAEAGKALRKVLASAQV